MNRKLNLLTFVALGAMVLAVAIPAGAQAPSERPAMAEYCEEHPDEPRCQGQARQEEERRRAEERRQAAAEHREAAEARREAAQERQDAAKERFDEFCEDPENETVAERCARAQAVHEPPGLARREANAIVHALNAMERRLERLEQLEERIEARLAEGNLTDNETARLEAALVRIDAQQERVEERIAHLEARLAALKERWQDMQHRFVMVCHVPDDEDGEPRTLRIPRQALRAHLAHGDTEGPCPAGDEAASDGGEADGSSDSSASDESDGADGSDGADDSDGSDDADDADGSDEGSDESDESDDSTE